MKKICVIGLGYIGLPTSIIAAQHNYEVLGFDIDINRVARINSFDPVIEEPELQKNLSEVLNGKTFKASAQIEPADFFVIAVPTPFIDSTLREYSGQASSPCKENKVADLSFVDNAIASICKVLKKNDVIILESTVPVGTTENIVQKIITLTGFKVGTDYALAHCPERVLPGNIFHELIHNSRIIGGITKQCMVRAASFYKKFVKAQLYLTNAATAEMVKLVENSSRDVNIAFSNQVAAMAYKKGLNPFEIIELANKHPRVTILNPSCGVGGHCIAVDPWFLIETFPEQSELLYKARLINDEKPIQVVKGIRHCVNEWQKNNDRKCTVLLLGLAYKPDIDDLRESPALLIAKEIMEVSTITTLFNDPYINDDVLIKLMGKSSINLEIGLKQADIIICLVKHKQFKLIDKSIINRKKILDYCGLFYEYSLDNDHQQEQLFWPASTAAIESIIEYVQKEV